MVQRDLRDWSSPFDGADLILGAVTASQQDWDAIVPPGGLLPPPVPGAPPLPGRGAARTSSRSPRCSTDRRTRRRLLPHAASIMLRGPGQPPASVPGVRSDRVARARVDGWEAAKGRVAVDTPFTQGLAGWSAASRRSSRPSASRLDRFGVVLASSLTAEPIEKSRRLLVTGVGARPAVVVQVDRRLAPRDTADPGLPPLLQEPFPFKVTWRRPGTVRAYALDANGSGRARSSSRRPTAGSCSTVTARPGT